MIVIKDDYGKYYGIDSDNIICLDKYKSSGDNFGLAIYIKGSSLSFAYKSKEQRDKVFDRLIKLKGGSRMEVFKSYLAKHQDSLITLAIIILVDHFLFDGALRERIKSSVEKILGHTEQKMIGGDAE
jgi:hypothetical protein